MKKDIVIDFNHVTKRYKLYKNDKQRLFGVFSKKVKYKEKLAVDDVSFQVERGDTVAFFGRNGAGKSTILKMITGVSFPNEGTITVNGRVSALLELTSGFDVEMTGRENIYLKGQLCGLKDDEIRELEKEIVEFADIDDYIDQPVRTYSSGMRARLGFAVNVNIRPEILIVDEALSVGDRDFRAKCLEKVNDIIENDGVTLLFVTHSTNTARQFCRRGIFLRTGRLVFDGDIEDAIKLYDNVGIANRQRRKARRDLSAAEAVLALAKTDDEIAAAKEQVEAARAEFYRARAFARAASKAEQGLIPIPENNEIPQASETPQTSEFPQAAEIPQASETPQAGEPPQIVEAPQAAESPQAAETADKK